MERVLFYFIGQFFEKGDLESKPKVYPGAGVADHGKVDDVDGKGGF